MDQQHQQQRIRGRGLPQPAFPVHGEAVRAKPFRPPPCPVNPPRQTTPNPPAERTEVSVAQSNRPGGWLGHGNHQWFKLKRGGEAVRPASSGQCLGHPVNRGQLKAARRAERSGARRPPACGRGPAVRAACQPAAGLRRDAGREPATLRGELPKGRYGGGPSGTSEARASLRDLGERAGRQRTAQSAERQSPDELRARLTSASRFPKYELPFLPS
jgi:hypothetical protein